MTLTLVKPPLAEDDDDTKRRANDALDRGRVLLADFLQKLAAEGVELSYVVSQPDLGKRFFTLSTVNFRRRYYLELAVSRQAPSVEETNV